MANPPASTERPEGRPLPKAALLDGPGQEDRSARCLTTQRIPRPRREANLHHHQAEAQPLGGRCAIRMMSWSALQSTERARERWCGGLPPDTDQDETHGGRGKVTRGRRSVSGRTCRTGGTTPHARTGLLLSAPPVV